MNTSKIIKGVVSNGRYTVTAPIVKEDYGLYLQIEGVELPQTYEVDFSNSENSGSSVTMIGNSDGVLIPHQFIETGKDVFAFLYHVGENFGRTVYKFRIPNKVRPDRTNEQPTPEEQSVIDQAISALNDAVAQTAQDVIDADASAQSASQSAEQAESAKGVAQNYAQDAQTSATYASQSESNAQASATASANSASQSAQIKADVEDLADDAQGYAQASAQSASASANSASQAQGFAQSASASAQSASGYASNAQTSANTASNKASDASTSAQTATQKATESAQSATSAQGYAQTAEQAKTASQTAQGLAESARDSAISAKNDAESARDDAESARDEAQSAVASIAGALAEKAPVITDTASGAIASFSDGADGLPLKSLVVDINPVQDLHGQESPYPAGGGKNLLKNNLTSQTKNGITVSVDSQGIITLTGTATVQTQFDINTDIGIGAGNYILSGISGGSTTTFKLEGKVDGSWGVNLFNGERSISVATGIEQLVIIVYNGASLSNVQIKPMIRLSTVTDATYAPYENICPISGWTEVDVEQRGVNVWDEEWEVGIFNANGEPSIATDRIRSKNFCPCVPNTEYYFVIPSRNMRIYFYNKNREFLDYYGYWDTSRIFTTPANAYFFKILSSAAYGTTYNHDISINYPSTDHSYHPYTGRSITIDLGQTVYGGKVDVLSGELVIDRAMVDLGTLNWDKNNSLNLFYTNIPDAKYAASAKGRPSICSALASAYNATWAGWSNFPDYSIAVGNNYATGFYNTTVKVTEYTDVASFKQMLTDTNARLVYELAEPLTIQLTPNQVNSLHGVNNIWADSGDTEVGYRADTKLYISKKIAEAISALS